MDAFVDMLHAHSYINFSIAMTHAPFKLWAVVKEVLLGGRTASKGTAYLARFAVSIRYGVHGH